MNYREKIIRDTVDLGLKDMEDVLDDVEKIIKNASIEELRERYLKTY